MIEQDTNEPSKTAGAASELTAGLCGIELEALRLYDAPFRFEHGYVYDARNNIVADDHGLDTMLRVRGWGRISYLPNPEDLQDTVGALIAKALTEYWQTHNVELTGAPHNKHGDTNGN